MEYGSEEFRVDYDVLKSTTCIQYLHTLSHLGFCTESSGGHSIKPLTAVDLLAHKELVEGSNDALEKWELKLIWDLSKGFVQGYKTGEKMFKKSPHEMFEEFVDGGHRDS